AGSVVGMAERWILSPARWLRDEHWSDQPSAAPTPNRAASPGERHMDNFLAGLGLTREDLFRNGGGGAWTARARRPAGGGGPPTRPPTRATAARSWPPSKHATACPW